MARLFSFPSFWPLCARRKKKALPTDDDALVRAARHSSGLRKICHERKNILFSFFFLSFFLFQGGFSDRDRVDFSNPLELWYIYISLFGKILLVTIDTIVGRNRYSILHPLSTVFIFVDDWSFEDGKNAQKQQPVTKDYKRLFPSPPLWNNLQGIENALSLSFVKSVLHLLHGWNVVPILLLYYVNLQCGCRSQLQRPYDTCDAVHRAHVNYPKKIYDASTRRAVHSRPSKSPDIYPSVINVEIRGKNR